MVTQEKKVDFKISFRKSVSSTMLRSAKPRQKAIPACLLQWRASLRREECWRQRPPRLRRRWTSAQSATHEECIAAEAVGPHETITLASAKLHEGRKRSTVIVRIVARNGKVGPIGYSDRGFTAQLAVRSYQHNPRTYSIHHFPDPVVHPANVKRQEIDFSRDVGVLQDLVDTFPCSARRFEYRRKKPGVGVFVKDGPSGSNRRFTAPYEEAMPAKVECQVGAVRFNC